MGGAWCKHNAQNFQRNEILTSSQKLLEKNLCTVSVDACTKTLNPVNTVFKTSNFLLFSIQVTTTTKAIIIIYMYILHIFQHRVYHINNISYILQHTIHLRYNFGLYNA